MRKLLAGILAALVFSSLPGLALADAAGTAKGVDPNAAALRGAATTTLVVGADIFIGDVVNTGDKGQVQILFADNTKLVVGPNSSLKIEDYLIRNNGSPGKLAVDMLAGSFRFSTGNAAKNRYIINTPTGTIGVRGTRFDTFVDKVTKLAWNIVYEGSIEQCSYHVCTVLSAACEVGQIGQTDTQVLGNAQDTKGEFRKQLQKYFIYAMNESPLMRQFRFSNAFDCLHRIPTQAPNYVDPQKTTPRVDPCATTFGEGEGGGGGDECCGCCDGEGGGDDEGSD